MQMFVVKVDDKAYLGLNSKGELYPTYHTDNIQGFITEAGAFKAMETFSNRYPHHDLTVIPTNFS